MFGNSIFLRPQGCSGSPMTSSNSPADISSGPPTSELTIASDQCGSAGVVRVAGEIDMLTAPSLLVALLDEVDRSGGSVVVDLSAVTFFGAAGLNALLSGRKYAEVKGRPLLLRRSSPAVVSTLTHAGVQHLFVVEGQPL